MKRSVLYVVSALSVLGAMLAPVSGGDKGGEKKANDDLLVNPYYPLKVGSTWEYGSGGKKVVVKVTKHEMIGQVSCARLETDSGGTIGFEHVTVKADGIYRVAANNQEIKPPMLVLKLPPKKGDSWSVESIVQNMGIKGTLTVGEEKLTIGKTEYAAFSVKSSGLTMGDQSVSMEAWFAKDIGMVKQRFEQVAAELNLVLELEKFTPGN